MCSNESVVIFEYLVVYFKYACKPNMKLGIPEFDLSQYTYRSKQCPTSCPAKDSEIL